jgi:hypothetical protein
MRFLKCIAFVAITASLLGCDGGTPIPSTDSYSSRVYVDGFGKRWRYNRNDNQFEDYQPPYRERRKILDGSRLSTIGKGLLWLAAGILGLGFAVSLIYKRVTDV